MAESLLRSGRPYYLDKFPVLVISIAGVQESGAAIIGYWGLSNLNEIFLKGSFTSAGSECGP